jgi:hypothetical protein
MAGLAVAQTNQIIGFGPTYGTQVLNYEANSSTINALGISLDAYLGENFGFYYGMYANLLMSCTVKDSLSKKSTNMNNLDFRTSLSVMVGAAGKLSFNSFTFFGAAGLGMDQFYISGHSNNTLTSFLGLYLGPSIALIAKYNFTKKVSAYLSFRGIYDMFAILQAEGYKSGFSFTPTIGVMFDQK